MKAVFISIIIIFCISLLNPIHILPWSSFFSESIFFIGFLLLILCAPLNILVKNTLPILFISFIPVIQFFFGKVYYFSIAFLGFIYIFCFWLSVVVGVNFTQKNNHHYSVHKVNIIDFISYFYIFICLVSSIIAIIQWLNIPYSTQYISGMVGNRPFANLAQANHLATLLCLGVLGCFFLYETKKINKYFLALCTIIFLFVIALTQSRTPWIFSVIFLLTIFFKQRHYMFRLSFSAILGWMSVYIMLVFSIPYIAELLSPYFSIVRTMDVLERATSGYLRLEIWNQAIHAIIEKPWFGYGWNQTSAAQYSVIDRYPGKEWFSSAHNIVLDVILWSGVFLGGLITIYFAKTYITCLIYNKNLDTIFACLLIMPVLIHSFLEYPFKYAYFLLPVGILWGVMISEKKDNFIKVKSLYFKMVAILGLVLVCYTFKEFSEVIDNNVAANTYEMNERTDNFELAYPVYILDEFEVRSQWFALNPYTKLNQKELAKYERIVSLHITPYDLIKYAKLLAYNNNEYEAKRQLKILKILYNKEYKYESLTE